MPLYQQVRLSGWPTDDVIGRIAHYACTSSTTGVRYSNVEWRTTVGEHIVAEGGIAFEDTYAKTMANTDLADLRNTPA